MIDILLQTISSEAAMLANGLTNVWVILDPMGAWYLTNIVISSFNQSETIGSPRASYDRATQISDDEAEGGRMSNPTPGLQRLSVLIRFYLSELYTNIH